MNKGLQVKTLGLREYQPVWEAMRSFTQARDEATPDEFWIVEHPPVFTQGRNGKPEHLLDPGEIPVVQVDRGGQVTYHGPGQVVVYVLVDLARRSLGVRGLVRAMEQAVVDTLAAWNIAAEARADAPGVYVEAAKVASLGLRVTRGRSYHGLSLNVDMDLAPFERINPCGYRGLAVTQLRELGAPTDRTLVADRLVSNLSRVLGYTILNEMHDAVSAPEGRQVS